MDEPPTPLGKEVPQTELLGEEAVRLREPMRPKQQLQTLAMRVNTLPMSDLGDVESAGFRSISSNVDVDDDDDDDVFQSLDPSVRSDYSDGNGPVQVSSQVINLEHRVSAALASSTVDVPTDDIMGNLPTLSRRISTAIQSSIEPFSEGSCDVQMISHKRLSVSNDFEAFDKHVKITSTSTSSIYHEDRIALKPPPSVHFTSISDQNQIDSRPTTRNTSRATDDEHIGKAVLHAIRQNASTTTSGTISANIDRGDPDDDLFDATVAQQPLNSNKEGDELNKIEDEISKLNPNRMSSSSETETDISAGAQVVKIEFAGFEKISNAGTPASPDQETITSHSSGSGNVLNKVSGSPAGIAGLEKISNAGTPASPDQETITSHSSGSGNVLNKVSGSPAGIAGFEKISNAGTPASPDQETITSHSSGSGNVLNKVPGSPAGIAGLEKISNAGTPASPDQETITSHSSGSGNVNKVPGSPGSQVTVTSQERNFNINQRKASLNSDNVSDHNQSTRSVSISRVKLVRQDDDFEKVSNVVTSASPSSTSQFEEKSNISLEKVSETRREYDFQGNSPSDVVDVKHFRNSPDNQSEPVRNTSQETTNNFNQFEKISDARSSSGSSESNIRRVIKISTRDDIHIQSNPHSEAAISDTLRRSPEDAITHYDLQKVPTSRNVESDLEANRDFEKISGSSTSHEFDNTARHQKLHRVLPNNSPVSDSVDSITASAAHRNFEKISASQPASSPQETATSDSNSTASKGTSQRESLIRSKNVSSSTAVDLEYAARRHQIDEISDNRSKLEINREVTAREAISNNNYEPQSVLSYQNTSPEVDSSSVRDTFSRLRPNPQLSEPIKANNRRVHTEVPNNADEVLVRTTKAASGTSSELDSCIQDSASPVTSIEKDNDNDYDVYADCQSCSTNNDGMVVNRASALLDNMSDSESVYHTAISKQITRLPNHQWSRPAEPVTRSDIKSPAWSKRSQSYDFVEECDAESSSPTSRSRQVNEFSGLISRYEPSVLTIEQQLTRMGQSLPEVPSYQADIVPLLGKSKQSYHRHGDLSPCEKCEPESQISPSPKDKKSPHEDDKEDMWGLSMLDDSISPGRPTPKRSPSGEYSHNSVVLKHTSPAEHSISPNIHHRTAFNLSHSEPSPPKVPSDVAQIIEQVTNNQRSFNVDESSFADSSSMPLTAETVRYIGERVEFIVEEKNTVIAGLEGRVAELEQQVRDQQKQLEIKQPQTSEPITQMKAITRTTDTQTYPVSTPRKQEKISARDFSVDDLLLESTIKSASQMCQLFPVPSSQLSTEEISVLEKKSKRLTSLVDHVQSLVQENAKLAIRCLDGLVPSESPHSQLSLRRSEALSPELLVAASTNAKLSHCVGRLTSVTVQQQRRISQLLLLLGMAGDQVDQ